MNELSSSTPEPAIDIVGLHKTFRIYRRPMDALVELVTGKTKHSESHVLNGINLSIPRGSVVGLIGRNGAGKSTLLKIIAGTLDSSAGSVAVNGRVTAILELGSGFHPDYTGRENIVMGGLCLGMSRAEIIDKTDEIISFSELDEVIDRPFRTYSSGMQARLTFSTAVSVNPDILIIDEALSVGDARFQAKSFRRIKDFRDQGKTILVVSHDVNALASICDRALILERGSIYADDTPKKITIAYQHLIFGGGAKIRPETPASSAAEQSTALQPEAGAPAAVSFSQRYGNGDAECLSWRLTGPDGQATTVIRSGEACQFCVRIRANKDIDHYSVGWVIRTRRGIEVFGITSLSANYPVPALKTGEMIDVLFDATMWLSREDYVVTLGIASTENDQKLDFIEDAIHFKVLGPSNAFTSSIVNLEAEFSIVPASSGRM